MNENKCDCYCGKIEPETLENQGVSVGYCGICEICGRQGHMRHAPGGVPYTGAWRAKCYRVQTIVNYLLNVGIAIAIISLVLGKYIFVALGVYLWVQSFWLNNYGRSVFRKLAGT